MESGKKEVLLSYLSPSWTPDNTQASETKHNINVLTSIKATKHSGHFSIQFSIFIVVTNCRYKQRNYFATSYHITATKVSTLKYDVIRCNIPPTHNKR